MKLAVVGCGAIGSYYGAKLSRAGHETHFLLRSDLAAVQAAGVTIHSPEGDFQVHPIPALKPEEIGVCDVVMIGLKTTANAQFPHLIPPLVGPRTTVVTLQNGLGNVEALARLFPPDQILGGLCFVALNRIAPGVIHHLAEGLVVLGGVSAIGRPAPGAARGSLSRRRSSLPGDGRSRPCSLGEAGLEHSVQRPGRGGRGRI